MAIPDKYKGKSFADIANKIQNKYKDRYDAVSIKGLNKEIQDLQSAQEYERAKMQIQEQIKANQAAQAQQMQQPQQGSMQQMQAPQQGANNQGVGFNPTQEQSTFKRQASSDYNEKFAYGGKMTNDYADGGVQGRVDGFGSSMEDNLGSVQMPDVNVQGVDLSDNFRQQGALQNQMNNQSGFNFNSKAQMGVGLGLMGAPLVSNLIQGLTAKPADSVPVRQVSSQGLSGLKNFRARESRFEDIDLDNIERGITEASGRFTQNNLNASRGNAGAFVANELGNQNNLYRSIADARMKAQIADRETDQLNASERARVDALNLQKESQVASMQGRNDIFNAQMQAKADVQNQQNEAAYDSWRSDLFNSAATGVANIGSTMFGAGQMGQMTDYSIIGDYLKKMREGKGTNEAKYGGNQYADGGMMGTDPDKKYFEKVNKDKKGRYVFPELPEETFSTQKAHDDYYSNMIVGYLQDQGEDVITDSQGNVNLYDTVATKAIFPEWKDKSKKGLQAAYAGDGKDPMAKVKNKKKFKKALRKARRQNK